MSLSPKFLTYEQIILLHAGQIDQFGGHHGVKDEGLVRSAIAQPQAGIRKTRYGIPFYETMQNY